MKDCLSLLGEKMSLSKTTLFLSFQIAQKRLERAVFHGFLAFFLIGKVVQVIIKSFTRNGQAQSTPMREMRDVHRPQIVEQ